MFLQPLKRTETPINTKVVSDRINMSLMRTLRRKNTDKENTQKDPVEGKVRAKSVTRTTTKRSGGIDGSRDAQEGETKPKK